MSFQDVGKPAGGYRSPYRTIAESGGNITSIKTAVGSLKPSVVVGPTNFASDVNRISPAPSCEDSSIGSVGSSTSGNPFGREVSDAILQYQRNVGLLENISKTVVNQQFKKGTTSAQQHEQMNLIHNQYQVQTEVVAQLGSKIESLLKQCETDTCNISSRTQATRARNTLLKLTRDYRTVQARYKNIALNVRQQQRMEQTILNEQYQEQIRNSVNEEEVRRLKLQLREEEDQLNLQIMREREEEILKINKGIHTVNQIYKV